MKERMDWTDIARYFYLPDERLQAISRDFSADIDRALAGEAGATVSAEKSYASLPEGDETGVFLALDFGGTNVRARGFASWDGIAISLKKKRYLDH